MAEESGNSSWQQKVRTNSYEGSNHSAILKQILRDTKEVTDWHSLGIQLEIPTSHLRHIEDNYGSNAERCKIEVVDYWLHNDPEPTQSKLAQAVDDMGGHTNVVQTLRASCEGVPETLTPNSGRIPCRALAVEKTGSGGFPQQSSSTNISDESSGYQSASQPECSHEQSNSLVEPSDELSDNSDEPITPVNCTCGNCHLYTLCTRGCYPGVGSDVSLPVWSGTGRNFQADDWDEWELASDTSKIAHAFVGLVVDTSKSFAQKVKVDEVVLCLRQLEVIKPLANPSMSLSETMEVNDFKNMDQLFKGISKYWSWYNYDLLENLIEMFGDKEDKTKLKKYLDKFTSFLKERLPKSQDSFSFGTRCRRGQKQLLIKVDEYWEIPLAQIRKLHHKIAEILQVSPHVLYFSSVSKGCICLEFLVPEAMAIPLRASQEEALVAIGVFRLECGECVFQDPSYMGHTGRPEEEDKGYEGCSESDGGSDVDQPGHSQAEKHARKKNSARKTCGKRIVDFSKFSASTDLMLLSEDFLKVLMLLPVLFKCTVLKFTEFSQHAWWSCTMLLYPYTCC